MPKEGFLTASQFAAALGINPYLSRIALSQQIRGLKPRFAGNAATEHGNVTEPIALAKYEAVTGLLVDGRQDWFAKRHYGTHVDGIALDLDGKRRLVEVKCPMNGLYEDIPPYYVPQILGQQWLADIDTTDFVAYHEESLAIWQVQFAPSVWEWMERMLDSFWEDVIAGRDPPRKKPQLPEFSLHIVRTC